MKQLIVMVLLLGCSLPGYSRHVDLDRLLGEIKQSHSRENQVNQERENRFLAEKNQQAARLSKSRSALSSEIARGDSLRSAFESNETRIHELEDALKGQAGELGELFGVVRQIAGDSKALINDSLISAQYPGRVQPLESISENAAIPTISQLESLWYLLQQEMTEQGKVVRFPGTVISPAGEPVQTEVVRIGPFNLVADSEYVRYLPETGEMVTYVRQPSGRYLGLLEDLDDPDGERVAVGVDPTSGVILGMLVRAPGVMERIGQGGMIGYIILLLGVVGVIVVIGRMVYLLRVGRSVDQQLADVSNIREDNPLGRVMAVSRQQTFGDAESAELMIDEAVTREVPALQSGLSLVKLLAAVAPLLGLLGTVTGMIETFQSISLFGTGDPRLMAGGISQALVTTMLGLMVAIPLLFLHSLMLTRSKRLIQILDEQSAGLICQNLQKEKGSG